MKKTLVILFMLFMIANLFSEIINIAENKPLTASSIKKSLFGSKNYIPENSLDGSHETYWSPAKIAKDSPEWLMYDLGTPHPVSGIYIVWKEDHAREFAILTSNDGESWTEVYTTDAGEGGVIGYEEVSLFGKKVFARYVKLEIRKAAKRNVTVYQFDVYGIPAPSFE